MIGPELHPLQVRADSEGRALCCKCDALLAEIPCPTAVQLDGQSTRVFLPLAESPRDYYCSVCQRWSSPRTGKLLAGMVPRFAL